MKSKLSPAEIKAGFQSLEQDERLAAAACIGELPKPQAWELLQEGLQHWDRRFRNACAPPLAKLDGAAATPLVKQAFKDKQIGRETALKSLSLCGTVEADRELLAIAAKPDLAKNDSLIRRLSKRTGLHLAEVCQGLTAWSPNLECYLDGFSTECLALALAKLTAPRRKKLFQNPSAFQFLHARGLVGQAYGPKNPPDFAKMLKMLQQAGYYHEGVPLIVAEAPVTVLDDWANELSEAGRKGLWKHKIFFEALQKKGVAAAQPQPEKPSLLKRLCPALGLGSEYFGPAVRNWKNLDSFYHNFTIAKRSGGERTILAPVAWLKFLQRQIHEKILTPAALHPACHGFRPAHSIITNARPHTAKEVVINIDLRDFFPGISAGRIYGLFCSLDWQPHESRFLTRLCTYQGYLPQGAPSSPMLANLVARRLDSRLAGLAAKMNSAYSRYADDLTFSGPRSLLSCLPLVRKLIAEEGFQVAEEKVRITGKGNRQEVAGLVVNSQVAVPRRTRRKLRAALHHLQNGKPATWNGTKCTLDSLRGRLAFLESVQPTAGAQMREALALCLAKTLPQKPLENEAPAKTQKPQTDPEKQNPIN